MIDIKNLNLLVGQIAEEHGISPEKIIESIEQSLAAAYKKEYGTRGQMIKAHLDSKTGTTRFWQVKLVVDKDQLYTEEELEELKESKESGQEQEIPEEERKIRFTQERHILVEDAKKEKKEAKAGDEMETELPVKEDFGRIAAQTAKQVILQKIREAEREAILIEFRDKEGELVSGIVQRVEGNALLVDLGKTLGIMPREEQVPGEFYRTGQRLKFYVLRVEESNRGPTIVLSRAHPKFISKLFELEVPEIGAESVHIKAIAREPGSRSKIAVESTENGVDPVGSMVGQRGTRVSAVINELGGEKIDIIEWAGDPEDFIANALSPAKAQEVKLLDGNRAEAYVAEDQLSLAIGREGQNVRLAAKLTGWKIDVRKPDGEKVETQEAEESEPEKENDEA
ncbi:MAG: transcription termination factor NusA [bacterium]|nr:transcription termination factor NusA [bacterium]MDZ4231749.1 transcription termination factor NusA [Candidatus Pacearchaeota archaeon]